MLNNNFGYVIFDLDMLVKPFCAFAFNGQVIPSVVCGFMLSIKCGLIHVNQKTFNVQNKPFGNSLQVTFFNVAKPNTKPSRFYLKGTHSLFNFIINILMIRNTYVAHCNTIGKGIKASIILMQNFIKCNFFPNQLNCIHIEVIKTNVKILL